MTGASLILASASPRRTELLRQAGLHFTTVPSPASELHSEHLTARELALLNAHRKARAVAKLHPDATVLGADTLVCLGSRVYGKPKDTAQASAMLTELQGRTHQVVTGICLVRLRDHRERLAAEVTDVRFRALGAEDIARYLALVHPLDKAGAYAIQEHGELIVEEITGSYTNVVGLPLERLRAELADWPHSNADPGQPPA